MARSNAVMEVRETDKGRLVFNVFGVGEFEFDPSGVRADLRARAELHGWKQRIADAAAMSRNPETGKPASPQDKFDAMQKVADYYTGNPDGWNMKRVSSGGGTVAGITIRAIAAVKGVSVDEARAMVEAAAAKHGVEPKAILATLRKSADVAAKVAELRAASASGDVDADALLDEI